MDSNKNKTNNGNEPTQDNEKTSSPNENLKETYVDNEEDEYDPPENETTSKGLKFNTMIIVGIFLIAIFVIMIIVNIFSNIKKNEKNNSELDKTGMKYGYEFKVAEQVDNNDVLKGIKKETTNIDKELLKEEIKPQKDLSKEAEDKIIANLPNEYRQQDPASAPVAPIGSNRNGDAYKSDRPDTRNSRSPRSIEGLKGQEYIANAPDTNVNIVRNAIYGEGYGTNERIPYSNQSLALMQNANGQRMTKEEYLKQQMQRVQNLQQSLYGNQGEQKTSFQQQRENFYNQGNGNKENGEFLSYNSLWEGTIISGALITSINTDNPGVVIARVTENVYSSYDHSFLLIPEGSLLYATYNSSISYGQNKVQVAWNLLIRPDGYRIPLGNMNGVSAQGVSGYKGFVNNHPWETLKALGMVAIYSVINTGVTKELKSQNNNEYSEYEKNAINDVYQQMSKMGNKMLDRALDIKPTITIHSGKEIKLITNIPLELPPVQLTPVTRKYIRTR